ncbi:cupin domain-containing protein [Pseudomonas gingeri]|uniref:Cupin domain-containing protein n=1 Tax=Pseudomonas gingeri TaxID=117681 RepID=A0A7Y8CLL5_9PSED|nr:cupin domain-containing protein [Pseudomonas gingeri]NWB27913.1 cupin domain-containing protein [Pseudomonas gingeri]NWC35437.1 cupin domain-containing protein [Pseudomonas gingeri]NWD04539.1 cupin domain-containing protein [Pseudomonas gingeri]NWD51395.1 cupin domain-containing protein [Pseudomonas gingeri]NWE28455.1 cupin domain-containing protein [Pseudomonas gingeri]
MILNRQETRQWESAGYEGMQISTVWNIGGEHGDGSFFLKFDKGTRFPLHEHDGWEQILMLEGTIRFGEVVLNAGDSLLLDANDQHDALALSDAKFFVAHHGGITIVA